MWLCQKMHFTEIFLVLGLNVLLVDSSEASLVWDDLVAARIRGQELGDMSGTTDIGIGDLHWNTTGMNIAVFDEFCSNLTTAAGGGVAFGFQVGTIVVSGEWNYTVDSVFTSERMGTFNVSIDGLALSFSVGNGPNNSWMGCETNVTAVGVEFHGEDSWYANFFHETVEEQIAHELEVSMCQEIHASLRSLFIRIVSWIAVVLAALATFALIYYKYHGTPMRKARLPVHRPKTWKYEKLTVKNSL